MADNDKRVPVPAGGAPIPAATENAEATPTATAAETATDTAVDAGDLVEARVLIDHGEHAPNDLIRDSAAEIERLKLAGVVDDHEDAVAFVKAG